jgi:RNA polymerase sigma factor (sigma-70 family)
MTSDPTVFIVDDDAMVRDAASFLLLANALNPETFASADDFLNQIDPSRSGCLLLDLRMPGMDGLELQQELQRRNISIPIIFFTGNADVQSAVSGLTNGAADFMEKPVQPAELISAVERAIEQDRRARHQREQSAEVSSRIATLTPREREVLELMLKGVPTKNIARQLGTSFETVKNQRSSILKKMNVANAIELVRAVTAIRTDGQTSGEPA